MKARLTPLRVALLWGGVALLYRALLTQVYYGQEEGDYGNLGLILGAWQSGFSYVETEHMPMYTWISAAVCAAVGDARTAGLLVSVCLGAVTVSAMTYASGRWLGLGTALFAGAALTFLPDLALVSATTLRGATYTAFLAGVLLAAGCGRWVLAGALFWGAFLTRFDAMFTALPLLAFGAVLDRERSARMRGVGVLLAAAVVPFWAALYRSLEGTARFWSGAVGRNTNNYSDADGVERLRKGAEALFDVLRWMLPDHLSWVLLALLPVGLLGLLRGEAEASGRGRVMALLALSTAGFFTGTVLLSAYRWDHNLYWSWLAVAAPFGVPVAVHGGALLLRRVPRPLARVVLVGLVLGAALPAWRQTWQQLIRSDQWLGTQVRLSRWADATLPPDQALLADLIPATWLGRRPDTRRVLRWSQQGDIPSDPEAFGAWLLTERIGMVIWFREEWVGAAERAPWLGTPGRVEAGPVTLEAVAAEGGYGFVAWMVTDGDPPPRPPANAGALVHGGGDPESE